MIMRNMAKEWEMGLLSKTDSPCKENCMRHQDIDGMDILKEDAHSTKVWRRARELLKHH